MTETIRVKAQVVTQRGASIVYRLLNVKKPLASIANQS